MRVCASARGLALACDLQRSTKVMATRNEWEAAVGAPSWVEAARAYVHEQFPDASVERIEPLGPDVSGSDESGHKAIGYGVPIRIVLGGAGGARQLVLHAASKDRYGHDRRADRAAGALLAFDTFGQLPSHVAALDVGAIRHDGTFASLRGCGEFYLLTEYVPGRIYAEDLRRIATAGVVSDRDVRRAETLAGYLAALHAEPIEAAPIRYTRAIRDLVGHGEGIFGLVDGFPADTPGAPPSRLRALEERAATWRWRMRGRESRLTRIHGDFHPFNIIFDDDDQLTLLDASRGCAGDPADDITCLTINYLFFGLQQPPARRTAMRGLWTRAWTHYFAHRSDPGLLEAAPPFFAWRALVLCNPEWYPDIDVSVRGALLTEAERALEQGRIDPESIAERM